MKRWFALALLLPTLLSLLSCGGRGELSKSFFLMDTAVTVTLYTTDRDRADEIFSECRAILIEYDALWSRTKETSDISRLNASRDGDDIMIDVRTRTLLQTAIEVNRATGGAFDMTVAPLVTLWEESAAKGCLPTDRELEDALRHVGSDRLILTDTGLKKIDPEASIDFGGIGKGAAIEALIAYLDATELDGGLVSFGSNVAVFGKKPDGSAFRIALRNPKDAGATVGTLTLSRGEILSVSGDYERYVTIDGTRYHHLLDPTSGYPAKNGLASVAVIAQSGALADALSTALFVMGLDQALVLYESGIYQFEAIFIEDQGEITLTDGVSQRFEKSK